MISAKPTVWCAWFDGTMSAATIFRSMPWRFPGTRPPQCSVEIVTLDLAFN